MDFRESYDLRRHYAKGATALENHEIKIRLNFIFTEREKFRETLTYSECIGEGEFRRQRRRKVSRRPCVNIDPQPATLFLSAFTSLLLSCTLSRRLFAPGAYVLRKLHRSGYTVRRTRTLSRWNMHIIFLVFQYLNYWKVSLVSLFILSYQTWNIPISRSINVSTHKFSYIVY